MAFIGSTGLSARARARPLALRSRRGSVFRRPVVVASIGGDVSAGFVQVCIGPKPYNEAVIDFIQAVSEAYKKGFSPTALQMEMSAEQGREMQADEVELRSVLITLVYKTLQSLEVKQEEGTPTLEFVPGPFDSFVMQIVEAQRRGYDLQRIQAEFSLLNPQDNSRSPLESAILRQGTRMVFETTKLAINW